MKTFKDAIDITRSMGIDYIWVDSLVSEKEIMILVELMDTSALSKIL